MNEIVQMTAAERAYQAYTLRISGLSWAQIANQIGYQDAGMARRSVNNLISSARDAASDEYKQEVLDLERERLDQLQAAYWDAAIAGDRGAFDAVIKVMTLRAKNEKIGEEEVATNRTIVITSEDYEKKLRELADE